MPVQRQPFHSCICRLNDCQTPCQTFAQIPILLTLALVPLAPSTPRTHTDRVSPYLAVWTRVCAWSREGKDTRRCRSFSIVFTEVLVRGNAGLNSKWVAVDFGLWEGGRCSGRWVCFVRGRGGGFVRCGARCVWCMRVVILLGKCRGKCGYFMVVVYHLLRMLRFAPLTVRRARFSFQTDV